MMEKWMFGWVIKQATLGMMLFAVNASAGHPSYMGSEVSCGRSPADCLTFLT